MTHLCWAKTRHLHPGSGDDTPSAAVVASSCRGKDPFARVVVVVVGEGFLPLPLLSAGARDDEDLAARAEELAAPTVARFVSGFSGVLVLLSGTAFAVLAFLFVAALEPPPSDLPRLFLPRFPLSLLD